MCNSINRLLVRIIFIIVILILTIHFSPHFLSDSRQTSDILQKFFQSNDQFNLSYQSTCSRAADQRGNNQKIISFSLYGNFTNEGIFDTYLKPLNDTINLIAHIYPGWIVRIYHNLTEDDTNSPAWRVFNKTWPFGYVDFCNVTEIINKMQLGNIFAMTWRWLPLLDEMVHTVMSRDADGQIIPREKEAVSEWLASERIFHIMRDHPAHCLFGFIMGGCWGVKLKMDRSRITHSAKKMFKINHLHEYDYDQILLDKFIWPIARDNMMAHDSYCCEMFQSSQPFPTKRKDRLFVGSRKIFKKGKNGTQELSDTDICPQKCRPNNTRSRSEWTFC